MKVLKYFLEFLFIIILFLIFRIIGYKNASNFGATIVKIIGPIFRSKTKILDNLKKAKIGNTHQDRENIIKKMWGNYGRILSEYIFLKHFRQNTLKKYIEVEGIEILNQLKKDNEQAIFISGHFNNFELMAMEIEKSGIELCAIYRPLNNYFLNIIMEEIRTKHICKKQIKKGKAGTRKLINLFNKGYSIALMIDQRVSEGVPVKFFNNFAKTTTIPSQFIKKYHTKAVPVYIERKNKHFFKISFQNPIKFDKKSSNEEISSILNQILEKMILRNPDQWIWTHDRWK